MNERSRRQMRELPPVGKEKELLERAARLRLVQQQLMGLNEAAYYLGWREVVNPKEEPKTVVYGHMGPDMMTPLVCMDARDVIGIDTVPINSASWSRLHHLEGAKGARSIDAFSQLGPFESEAEELLWRRAENRYFDIDSVQDLGISVVVLAQLVAMGVDPQTVEAKKVGNEAHLQYVYGGKLRKFRWIEGKTSDVLVTINEPVDIFLQKAQIEQVSVFDQKDLRQLQRILQPGGYVMSSITPSSTVFHTQIQASVRQRTQRYMESMEAVSFSPVRAPIVCNRIMRRAILGSQVPGRILYGTYLQVAQKKASI